MPSEQKFNFQVRFLANLFLVLGFSLLVLFIQGEGPHKPTTETQSRVAKINVAQSCKTDQSYSCFKQAFISQIKSSGIKASLETLGSLNDSNQTVRQYCHSLSHDLGRAAFEVTGGNIGKIFTEGNTTCWSGFYHGALEKAFGRSQDLASTARGICTEKNGVSGAFLNYQCLHGLGHGLSARFDNEIYSALSVCEKLETSYQQSSCYGGVFMENYVADGINHKVRYVSEIDPIAPCNQVSEKFKFNCYQLVSIQILKSNSYNFAAAFKTCENSDPNYVSICYQSVGRDVSGYVAEDWDQALSLCGQGNLEAEKICVGAVSTDSVYSRSSADYAKILCNKARAELKSDCYRAAGESIAILFADVEARKEACEIYEQDFIATCKQAASVF